jgi:hypothetical protein
MKNTIIFQVSIGLQRPGKPFASIIKTSENPIFFRKRSLPESQKQLAVIPFRTPMRTRRRKCCAF